MFRYDSKLMQILGKVADLMIINIWTILCSLPLITMGASLTAMHYAVSCCVRDIGDSCTGNFFKSFRINFKKATIAWLFELPACALIVLDWYSIMFLQAKLSDSMSFWLVICQFLIIAFVTWFFGLQAHYQNSLLSTAKNALILMLSHPLITIAMVLVQTAPFWLSLLVTGTMPLALIFGCSGPVMFSSLMYRRVFTRIEKKKAEYAAQEQEKTGTA